MVNPQKIRSKTCMLSTSQAEAEVKHCRRHRNAPAVDAIRALFISAHDVSSYDQWHSSHDYNSPLCQTVPAVTQCCCHGVLPRFREVDVHENTTCCSLRTARIETMTAHVLQHTQQCGAPEPHVCRASVLTPPESMESNAQQGLKTICNGGGRGAAQLAAPVEQLQQLHLTALPAQPRLANGVNGVVSHLQGSSSSRSSGSEECSSSSSSRSDMMSASAAVQHVPAGEPGAGPSSSASVQQAEDTSVEPLLQDNPDRFTLSPIQ